MDVKVGDLVKKDQSLGVAGATGMAGGVHVHFSMQIDGVQVNPREWWDEHWIHDRIMSKLDPNAVKASSEAPKVGTVSSQPRARGKRRRK
jgi:murein DD-endopeptidase MepM/ murein hydrolase activator NlpD